MLSMQLDVLLGELPEALRQRVAWADHAGVSGRKRPLNAKGRYVLYWMRTAARGHENPALDLALHLGKGLQLPVFVYHALSERYPFASDRLHTFAMQGAVDVASELDQRGVGYAFHLERPGHRGDHLKTLGRDAALIVTELMPVAPLVDWSRRLWEAVDAPLLFADTACVVPMPQVPRAFDRAFAFRRETEQLRQQGLAQPWQEAEAPEQPFVPNLPFDPIELSSDGFLEYQLPRLVAACEIDHSVAPVAETPGGSRAGYQRWAGFFEHGLERYHRERNDPIGRALPAPAARDSHFASSARSGASRLSAYLHFGHISTLRIARQAAARGGAGAAKYLDELLVWRELAYNFCFWRPEHGTIEALPAWARSTLEEHSENPRADLLPWAALARARSGDALWDAAQRSLLRHGELHNNLRMTWGKAILGWTSGPAQALDLLEDLNHRFALDGRDPASYGGLLWCLGQFDRPFTPSRPILGTVRPRPTREHLRRLDLDRYSRWVERSSLPVPPRIAVIGAGVAGLACARVLADHGLSVTVWDKGRGPGGRASTRRIRDAAIRNDRSLASSDRAPSEARWAFDHGAQYLTARDPRFVRHVHSWAASGAVQPWSGRLVALRGGHREPVRGGGPRYVGVPGMNEVLRHLGEDLSPRYGTRVERIEAIAGDDGRPRYRCQTEEGVLSSTSGERDFDLALLALPAPQAVPLLQPIAPDLAQRVSTVQMSPCWAVMVALPRDNEESLIDFDGAFIHDSPLTWACRDSSKPGRVERRGAEQDLWVLHADPEWSTRHLESTPEQVQRDLLQAFSSSVGRPLPQPLWIGSHLWRYARTPRPLGADCLLDLDLGLGLCGDWCPGERVEGAFLSGTALAGQVLGQLAARARHHEWPDQDRGGPESTDPESATQGTQLNLFS